MQRITLFIEPGGMITIDNLFADVLPLALSLDPENKRVKRFISGQNRIAVTKGTGYVSFHDRKDEDN